MNTGTKMKKLALNFLKTADEKLRNIGKHQPVTIVQTQNFTFYKNQPIREHESPLQPQQLLQQQSPQQLQQRQGPDEKETSLQQPHNEPVSDLMDERVMLRHGRRERNGLLAAGEAERSDFKRRSRSEGPNRRIRQSMDERESGKKQTFDGGGKSRKLQESSDSDDSDRNLRQTTGCVVFESDSDSDPKKWTKNPLVVRRVKRSDKTKQPEKRFSGTENGMAAKNRDSWVYYGNDDGSSRGSFGGGNSSSRDSGSSTKGSSKYQKLEEMRKKRINLAVTSDEENTPASRISRLRQRALQGGLGEQPKSANISRTSALSNDSVQWEDMRRQHQQRSHVQPIQNVVSSDPGIHKLSERASEVGHFSQTALERPQHVSKIIPVSQSPSFTTHTYLQNTKNVEPAYTASISTSKQNIQPVNTNAAASLSDLNRGLNQQPSRVQQKISTTQQSQPKQAPARPPPPNLAGARQSFYTIPEPNSSQTNRALNNSSPEVAVRKFTTQVRIPSFDSIVTSAPKAGMASANTNQPVTFSNNLRQIQARGSPTPNQELFQALNTSKSPSQFTDAVEIRLTTTRDGRLEPQQKIPKKIITKSSSFAYSDDTLDELIESNIQYLDSEYDMAKSKRNSSTNVIRSSSLPDPRRMSSHAASAPNINDQPSIQVQASTSIQFHVSLPTDPRGNLGTPVIQIAPSNSAEYQSEYSFDSHLRSQPDVVPRKYSYDCHSRISRPSSEYYDRDDMSKSDSQLNAQIVIPSYLGNSLHPDQAYARGCVSDINLRSDFGSSLIAPQMDKGMFSDVEYDIEVSERVKKWETFMKVNDSQISNEKKNLNLTTIQENTENESLMLPSEIRKSVLLSKNGGFGSSYAKDITCTPSNLSRPFNSDTTLHKSGDVNSLRMFSVETNANKFCHVIHDPQVGPRLGIQSQSVTSLFHTPIASRPEKSFMSANELRQQMLANRQPPLPITSGSLHASFQPYQSQISENHSQKDMSSVNKVSNQSEFRDVAKRGSRYHEELNEISNVKSDSVINLRRRFDADSASVTSEDDRRLVSTASAKLSRPTRESPSFKETESVDWSNVLPGYETKIKDSDVWSPNLESTQGVPVSIERVTARTLQTIPFSEDPFWKEIEEMTSFDPSSMAGHLSVCKAQDTVSVGEPIRSQHQVELTSPHSSTLPNQPRNNTMPMKERMQRSKSLYTPNITPLSISVADKTPSSVVSALDDVLEDISRSSLERKQLSPKKKAFESDSAASTSSGVSNIPSYLKEKHDQSQPAFTFEGGQFKFIKPSADSQSQRLKQVPSGNTLQEHTEKLTFQTKQPVQFYQQQRQQSQQQGQQSQQQVQNRQSQVLPTGSNSYHLDPNLLKQKLLNTGLVVETDTEEPVRFKQSRSSSLGSTAPIFKEHSTTAPAYSSNTSQANMSVRSEELVKPSLSFASSHSVGIPHAGSNTAAPWSVKQSGSSALEDIQKALAPFQSTAYQPDPETLYGTSRFQSFNKPNFDTSRGSNTKTTSWTYQSPLKTDNEISNTNEVSSSNSLSRLQQVNASMDDLKDLAQNVERKINDIKGKLQTADEKSLDSILASLRKLTPEVKSRDMDSANFEDYYTTKKSKLSDALAELNRIYKDLELSNDSYTCLSERGKYKPYRTSKSGDFVIAPQPKSEHLRPMQTRISSVYIPGLEIKDRTDLDKETESEFDVLSRSFQAIVDEVNQTTDMFSRAAESRRPENMAPETQKQISKIALKYEGTSSIKAVLTPSTDNATATKVPPATAPKPQEVKPNGGRFRSKLQNYVGEDDSSVKRARSKSISGLESNTKDLLGSTTEGPASGSLVSQTVVPTTGTLTESSVTTTATAATRQRLRFRPVRDNKIIQDEKTTKIQGPEKAYGITQSPQPSPSVSRKIIYNTGLGADVTVQSIHNFQDANVEEIAEANPSQEPISVKQPPHILKNTYVQKSGNSEINVASVSSPASHKKVPPPTAAKPSVKSETPVSASTFSTEATISINVAPTGQQEKVPTAILSNTNKSELTEVYANVSDQNKATSTKSINLTHSAPDQSKLSLSSSKQDEAEVTSSGGHRTKRKLGTGVAMILDKFNTGEENGDRMKKRPGTRSAPDLIESLNDNEEDENADELENSRTTDQAVKTQPEQSLENKVASPKVIKNPAQRPVEKRIHVLATDGNKSQLSKSVVVTSLERKVSDSETKAPSSEASTPRPSSPSTRPPQHPWKRQMSDPDRQNITDVITESSVGSPKFVSKIPRLVTGNRSMTASAISHEPSTSKKNENPLEKVGSPKVMPRRVRPPDRKMQTETLKARPHSFHGFVSCFEKDQYRFKGLHKFRKYASADEVSSETVVHKVVQSESKPTTGVLRKGTTDNRGGLLKPEMKLKS